MKFWAHSSSLLLLTPAFVAAPIPAFSYQFEAIGGLCVSNYLNDSVVSTQRYDFEISVSNNLWQLRTADWNITIPDGERSNNAGSKFHRDPDVSRQDTRTLLRMLAGTDGESVFGYSVLQDGRKKSAPQAFVTQGPKPQFNPHLQLVWMAFASSEYLDTSTNTPPQLRPPWNIPPADSINTGIRAEVKRGAEPPYLPMEILFYKENPGVTVASRPGEVLGRYQVLSTTNYAGLSIPISCSLERFKSSKTNKIVSRYRVWVEAVRKPDLEAYLPEAPKGMLVLDYRFMDRSLGYDFTPYHVKNGWRSSDDPELVQMAASRKDALRHGAIPTPKSTSLKRRFFLGLLFLSLGLPILFFYKMMHREQTNIKYNTYESDS